MNALDWTGRPWEAPHGCWRLLCAFYATHLEIHLPTFDDQVPDDDRQGLAALMAANLDAWVSVPAGHEQFGDGVLFKIWGLPSHVGIVVSPGHFLHVLMRGHYSCIENYRTPKWAPRIEGFYRHRDAA